MYSDSYLKKNLFSTSTPTINNSGRSSKKQGIIFDNSWTFLKTIRYGFYQEAATCNSQVFRWTFLVRRTMQLRTIQFVVTSADWHSMRQKNIARPSALSSQKQMKRDNYIFLIIMNLTKMPHTLTWLKMSQSKAFILKTNFSQWDRIFLFSTIVLPVSWLGQLIGAKMIWYMLMPRKIVAFQDWL